MNQAAWLLGLLVLLLGCSESKPLPTFDILVTEQGEQVTSEISHDKVRFNVDSQTGIGHAEVKLASGEWPERVCVRLNKTGLESFKFSYSDTVIEVSVQSSGESKVLRSAMQIGKELQPAGEGTVFFMPVELGEDGNWFEISAPANFHEVNPELFRIDWIDFYR